MTPAEQIQELSDSANAYAAALASANFISLRIRALAKRMNQVALAIRGRTNLSEAEAKPIEAELRELNEANQAAAIDFTAAMDELEASQARRAACAQRAIPLMSMLAFAPTDLPGVIELDETSKPTNA